MNPILIVNLMFTYSLLYFLVFWMVTYLLNRKEMMKDPKPKRFPSVSVIIPVWNEVKTIKRCIQSAVDLRYPGEKEIIVVDDGSTDGTSKICKEFEKKGFIKLITRDKGGEGKHVPLNIGVKAAKGELISTMDSDSWYDKDTLMHCVGHFDDSQVMGVRTSIKVAEPRTALQLAQKVEYIFGLFLAKTFDFFNSVYVLPGPGGVIRKSFIEKHGYFKDNITEDMEMGLRIQKQGYKIMSSINAVTYTITPAGFRSLFRQRLRWLTGFIENFFEYKGLWGKGVLGAFLFPMTFLLMPSSILFVWTAMFKPAINFFSYAKRLHLINYDLLPFILGFNLSDLSPLLLINSTSIVTLMLMPISLFMIITAYRMVGEKNGVVETALFLFLYPFVLSVVSISSFYLSLRRRVTKNDSHKLWVKT
ncbi:MAG: glycosyltransferase family 2 protein [Nanoarchaeota archaeon]|nr:glycosyltransferase family 2 protein [Nanoarchaeota archaeon]